MRYFYNTDQYFRKVILERIQKERTAYDANGKMIKPPSKKDLWAEIIHFNKDILTAAIEYTGSDPSLLEEYHKNIPRDYSGKNMNDEMLDNILYHTKI